MSDLIRRNVKIAIIDDNDLDAANLESSIKRYQEAHKDTCSFAITKFNRGINFLEPFNDIFDVAFLDIDMPVMSGLECAKKIRENGSQMSIVFVTNYASLAVDGYGVDALDFVVKPVKDVDLNRAMDKLFNKLEAEEKEDKLIVKTKSGYQTIRIKTIKYVEINVHDVYYYTTTGVYKTREVLKQIEKNINNPKFVMCSSSYLINLDFVDSIEKDDIRIDGRRIKIARTRKKDFIAAFLNNYR